MQLTARYDDQHSEPRILCGTSCTFLLAKTVDGQLRYAIRLRQNDDGIRRASAQLTQKIKSEPRGTRHELGAAPTNGDRVKCPRCGFVQAIVIPE